MGGFRVMPVAPQLPDPLPSWAAWEAARETPFRDAAAHLARELHYRQEVYARRVARRALAQEKADWHLAAWSEILSDHLEPDRSELEHAHITYHDKIRELETELHWRFGRFPKSVAEGKMTPAEAEAEIVAVHAILDHYRTWGFSFRGDRAARRALTAEIEARTAPQPDLLAGAA